MAAPKLRIDNVAALIADGGANRTGRLSPNERLAVACRIAGVTQLCNRFAVFIGPESDTVPPEDVFLNDLLGGTEHATDEIRVSVDAILEVLDTGLFSSRGLNRIGWAHQTYAEFPAARYCKKRAMPLRQIRPLIFHPSEGGRRLILQLREIAGWMSATDPDILEAVATSDPEALLGAAAAGLSENERRLIVDSLLGRTSEGRTLHLEWGLVSQYPKLKHAKLSENGERRVQLVLPSAAALSHVWLTFEPKLAGLCRFPVYETLFRA